MHFRLGACHVFFWRRKKWRMTFPLCCSAHTQHFAIGKPFSVSGKGHFRAFPTISFFPSRPRPNLPPISTARFRDTLCGNSRGPDGLIDTCRSDDDHGAKLTRHGWKTRGARCAKKLFPLSRAVVIIIDIIAGGAGGEKRDSCVSQGGRKSLATLAHDQLL